jgi:IS30 family transposase
VCGCEDWDRSSRSRRGRTRRPWQRATNENTNGLLRQYFPKSSDLSAHSADDLNWVAAELNDRPRKRLGFKKPIEQIGPLLLR